MAVQNDAAHERKQLNSMQKIVIVLLVLLLAAMIAIIFLLFRDKPQVETDTRPVTRGTVVTQDNAETLVAEDEVIQDGYYDVSMSIDWHFKDGATEDAKIANKETNKRTVYFDLLTEETEEVVYSSPYIPVGEYMQGFTLDKELAPGTYDMIVRYYLVDDNSVEVSNVSVGLTIYVE